MGGAEGYRSGGRGRSRRPRALGEVLGELYVARGLGRLRGVGELEAAWAEVVGPEARGRTAVTGLRHGVLTVTVAHPTLLEELAAFRKPDLLAGLRQKLPGLRLHDLRFRVGPVVGGPDGTPRA
jgi:predicted nucleic acid-binding Zn ribbon protein